MNKHKQAGFSAVELLLVLAVVGLLGFIGWRVYDNSQNNRQSEAQNTQDQTSADEVPAIRHAEDLDKSVDYLQEQNLDADLDTSEIDAALQ